MNDELYLTPLIPLVGRGEGAIVAVVGRERGELFRLRGGKLEPVADRTEEQPGQHDQGGWSQARYQRHIEHLVHEHLERVAEELDRRVRRARRADRRRRLRRRPAAPSRTLLSKEVRDAIVGWTTAEAHAGPPELLAAASPVLEAWRAREEEQAVERWREEAGREGRAASGWSDDARGRIGRTRRPAALPERCRARRLALSELRPAGRRGRHLPARRDADGDDRGRARPRRPPHALERRHRLGGDDALRPRPVEGIGALLRY